LVLAGCSSPSTAGAPTTSAPAKAGANPHSTFCTSLAAEQASVGKLSTAFESAIAQGNLSLAKSDVASYFTHADAALKKVETTMVSAPATVRAALRAVNLYYAALKSTIDNATSTKELATGIQALAKNPSLGSATSTLNAYTASQCGTNTSTT
jgi:translation initiation factor 2B subunit (eIF-2B alpha/beta/delta family)